jgi:quercetin dioxygenase-like cupin family protein
MPMNFNEPRVVSFVVDEFERELVPGVAHMKHLFGNDTSVALFKIAKGSGTRFPATAHAHGEEIALQLKGSSWVEAAGKRYTIRQGELIVMPAGLAHSGVFTDDEESWLLAICTPPREDYGPQTW